MTASLAAQVVEICREVLEDASVSLDSTAATVKHWDSLGHMNLITALEARFGVELDVMQMAEVDGVRALVDVLAAALRGSAKRSGDGG